MTKKADMIIDLQYGSTGKGLIAGYLATKNEYDVVVSANMPNAGHTFIDDQGNKMIHKVLPNGIVSPKCRHVLIGPGAVFDINRLNSEITTVKAMGYDHFSVVIHKNAVVLNDSHKTTEQAMMGVIGSTMQGSAEAMIQKIRRNPKIRNTVGMAVDSNELDDLFTHKSVYVANNAEYDSVVMEAGNILLEGAQGFSLGINERFYPFCTSRDCTPARFLADMAIPIALLRKVIGTARTYPIRVGNPPGGWSGGCYPDQTEITWADIGVKPELTTVTQRERRVFSFSTLQIRDAIWHCCPDEIFLNFCNYVNDDDLFNSIMASFFDIGVRYFGYGPTVKDVVDNHDD